MLIDWYKLHKTFPEFLPEIEPTGYQLISHKSDQHRVIFGDINIKYANLAERADEIYREAHICQLLQEKLSISIPNPIKMVKQEKWPFAYFIYRRIEGNSLHNNQKKLNDPKIIEHVTSLWNELQQLHLHEDVSSELIAYQPDLRQIREDIHNYSFNPIWMDEDKIGKIKRFVDLCVIHLDTPSEKLTFVHGDFWTGNILFKEESEVVGLLDFSRCWLADPMVDLAKLAYSGSNFMENILVYYGEHFSQTNLDRSMLKALLHRGLFILIQLLQTQDFMNYRMKLNQFVIKSLDRIEQIISS